MMLLIYGEVYVVDGEVVEPTVINEGFYCRTEYWHNGKRIDERRR